jgi:hypothetical protein
VFAIITTERLHSAALPTTLCDGKSHGYFSGDVDNFKEPLLYTDKQQPAGEQNGPVQSSSGFVANDTSVIAYNNHTARQTR